MTTRRAFMSTLAGSLLAAPLAAGAQQAGKVARIGFLGTSPTPPYEGLTDGLRQLGWVEGQNLTIERRFSGGRQERFRDLAAELVRLNVDVIVTASTPASVAAKTATTTVPIVMEVVIDPVGAGLVTSLARPPSVPWHAGRQSSRSAARSPGAAVGKSLADRAMRPLAGGHGDFLL